jgi:glucokinase
MIEFRENTEDTTESWDVFVGVDIGGTNTAVGFVCEDGKRLLQATFPTRGQDSAAAFIRRFAGVMRELIVDLPATYSVRGIGIASPAANGRKGTVENPANLHWGKVNLVELVKEQFDLPVAITNDANAALLGEMEYGVTRGMSNVIMITLGTGLGAGIVLDGKLVQGENGAAGEFGHITLDPQGRFCGCGRRGCVETYVSANGIRRTVSALLAERIEESRLRHISFEALTAESVFQLAREGDVIARAAFEVTGSYLGRLIANLAATFDPEAVVLFGGLVNSGELLVDPARRAFEEHVMETYRGKVQILVSSLNDGQAAVLGASCLVRDMMFGVEWA